MDHPALPASPVKPKKLIVIALTLLAAIMAAAGAALSKELLDDRLTTPEKVFEVLGVPVLASFE
jgi:capsular polysaccharide biosynthesis protein